MSDCAAKTGRALSEFRLDGAPSNLSFLQAVLARPEWETYGFDVAFIEREAATLVEAAAAMPRPHFGQDSDEGAAPARLAGAKVDEADPLAVLDHGRAQSSEDASGDFSSEDGYVLQAPMQGSIVSIAVVPGDEVWEGRVILIMESMKMEHEVAVETSGVVRSINIAAGDVVFEDSPLLIIDEVEVSASDDGALEEVDLDYIRPDCGGGGARGLGHDANRLDATRRKPTSARRARTRRSGGSRDLIEWPHGIAARRLRMEMDELIRRTPADGMIGGIGEINGALFPEEDARCMIMSYDYTVLAGTQGKKNHQKKDRLFRIAEKWRLPVVFFAEGGGGRPGDSDVIFAANLHTPAFNLWGKLSGNAPMVGIVSGRCFAGNAVVLGCCDVVIATANSTIGMGGPAMIEGGGLGVYRPEEVGPMSVMKKNGVVDIAVEDEAEAVAVAKKYISYFQGTRRTGSAPTNACCAMSFRRTGSASMKSGRRLNLWRIRTRFWNSARISALA